ncbi:MAG: hypothetical protein IPH09_08590 [bacterium]|nr:hypothetical protein [bacterium]
MSATPIPRSLALTLYGDLDLSILDEMPAGRRPVATGTVAAVDLDSCYAGIRDRLRAGERAFVIYPVIEETAGQDLRSAEAEYERLAAGPFRDHRVGLLHGRMKSRDKQAVMAAFASGELEVLVATSVVEVGIDVPRATAMVIHHPERFGLAQLHQLRGRIGRSGWPRAASSCSTAGWPPTPPSACRSSAPPRTASAWPKRTCGGAVPATCSACASTARRPSSWPTPCATRPWSPWPPPTPPACWRPTRASQLRASAPLRGALDAGFGRYLALTAAG